jgi:hypothetical protein
MTIERKEIAGVAFPRADFKGTVAPD